MNFKPIASSSKGNAYLVESHGVAPLLIECGIPIKQLRTKVWEADKKFILTDLAGCLISHEHSDHCKAAKDLLKAGIDIYTSKETAEALGIADHYRVNFLNTGDTIIIDSWKVLSFDLAHDVPCQGFFIQAPDGDKCLFIADTSYIRNRFEGINILCIECNNVEGILSDNIVGGKVPVSLGHRVRRNHLSLERVIQMLKANDLSACREIWLLHLSDSNSDEARMIRTVQEQTGIPTRACAEII
jgi:phosphoribosyl 1,2-cyclic phosphodiesterase